MARESVEGMPPQENGEHLDSSKLFILFTGQGSQFVGMGKDLYEHSEAAREVFHNADEAVGFPLSEIMFKGPEEILKKTDIAQTAIVTFEIATLRTVEAISEKNIDPKAYAGHSLGNYAAIVAAEATSFPDTIRLVQERGRLMQEAANKNPGSMAAIMGLDLEVLKGICDETGAEIGIVNTDNQVVITGSKLAVAQAITFANASHARRVTELQVSGAWHSSLMKEAQEEFGEAVYGTRFNKPKKPIYSNYTGRPLTTAKALQDSLVGGLRKPLNWNRLFKNGIVGASAAVEFGPKDILSGFARQIKRDFPSIPVNSFASAEKLAQLIR